MKKDNTMNYILIGLGLALVFGFGYWYYQKTQEDKQSPTDTPNTNGGGNGGSNATGGNNNAGNTGTKAETGTTTNTASVTPIYNQFKGTKVLSLGRKTKEAKLAQYIIKEGLKAYGLPDNVGKIDGIIGNNTKAGLASLIGQFTAPWNLSSDTITLEMLAMAVNQKIGGGQSVDTGISKITYSLINA